MISKCKILNKNLVKLYNVHCSSIPKIKQIYISDQQSIVHTISMELIHGQSVV